MKNLGKKTLNKFQKNFKSSVACRVAMNAVTRGDINEIAINRDTLNDVNYCFSHEIETGVVTDQKKANTCWMFAALNWLRAVARKKLGVKDIEFSANYLIFWDKLEKANYFFEDMISLADRDLDDRELHYLLKNPTPDDGEWHMMVNLIKKYGLLPKSAMAETFNSENTKQFNFILSYKLREGAAKIRELYKKGKTPEEIRKKKMELMEEIYRILGIFLGIPPEKFNWGYRDKDNNFHGVRDITPHKFFKDHVGISPEDIYILWSCPSQKTPYYKTYTIAHTTYMSGGQDLIALNLPTEKLKHYALEMVKNGDPCLFGCDVLQESNTKEGLLYCNLYDYDIILQTEFNLDKTRKFDYCQSFINHLMLLTGVDIADEKPVKWKVENSWGDKHGKKGYFMMSDRWFDEHVMELMVPKERLSKEDLELFKLKPVVMPRWFAMI